MKIDRPFDNSKEKASDYIANHSPVMQRKEICSGGVFSGKIQGPDFKCGLKASPFGEMNLKYSIVNTSKNSDGYTVYLK